MKKEEAKVSDTAQRKLNTLLEKYADIFSAKPGRMRNFKAKIHVKGTATPKFSKARTIPF